MMMANEKTMTFNVLKILEQLKKNAEIHEKEYQELVIKNNLHMRQVLTQALGQTSSDGTVYPDLSKIREAEKAKPVNHSAEYRRLISMLEMTTQETIDLTMPEFDRYMNDNWDWKMSFLSNKTMYGMS